MFLAAPLALLLIAAVPEEGRGAAGMPPEEARELRTSPRVRLGVGGGVLFGIANYSPALGVGFTADLGVVLNDRLALFVHGEVGTIVITLIGSGALVVEYSLNEQFSVGLGAAFSAWTPVLFGGSSNFYGLTFPVRLNYAPVVRLPHQTRRSGLLLGLQVAPGFSLQPTNFFQVRSPLGPEPAFTATASAGFAWW